MIVIGSLDKCIGMLRESHKDDMQAVTEAIFSHSQVAKKNLLIIALIVISVFYFYF